jgi:GH25 family lysozyme M1 (1,4-beta-N-acetylmuramidase)
VIFCIQSHCIFGADKNVSSNNKIMRKIFLGALLVFWTTISNAQTCASGGCTAAATQTSQYPTTTFASSSSAWNTVSAYMNAGNWTLFNITSGQTYEWTYCANFGGSQGWDAELTLFNNASNSVLCYANNSGLSGCTSSPYISWTATFTGVVKLLTTQSGCVTNSGAPYSKLVWRNSSAPASSGGLVYGIDVSGFQPYANINWTQLKAGGIEFAWAKATQGTTYFSSDDYDLQIAQGLAANVKMGAYHFAEPLTNSAIAEANYFLSYAQDDIISCQLIPMLDLENYNGYNIINDMSSNQLSLWAKTWLDRVKLVTGISPVIYGNGYVIEHLNNTLLDYSIMVAYYQSPPNATSQPWTTGVWPTWKFKQYSETGNLAGYNAPLDLNVFNGNLNEFYDFIGCNTTPICTPPAAPTTSMGQAAIPGSIKTNPPTFTWGGGGTAQGYRITNEKYPFGSGNASYESPSCETSSGVTPATSNFETGMIYRWIVRGSNDCATTACESLHSNISYFHIKPEINYNTTLNLCNSNSIVLSTPVRNISSPAAISYQWYKDGNIVGGATSANYSVTNAGSYKVVVTFAGSTLASSSTIESLPVAFSACAAIEEISGSIGLFPTILSGIRTFEISTKLPIDKVQIYDITGREINVDVLNIDGKQLYEISASVPSQTLIVNISTKNGVFIKRIIIN